MVTAHSGNTFLSPYPLVSYVPLSLSLCLPLTMWSPHCYIPSGGPCFSCHAAEGVTEGCILRVLLLTLYFYHSCFHTQKFPKVSRESFHVGKVLSARYYFH